MRNLSIMFGLLVLLGSTRMASANEFYRSQSGSQVFASFSLPGFRLVLGHPGIYGWYQGHYYSRLAWERFYRFRQAQLAYRYHRYDDRYSRRNFDRDRDFDRHRDYDRD